MEINELTGSVIESAIKIHSTIGPGCYEKVYEEILCYELNKKGLQIDRQLVMPINYEDLFIEHAYKVDLIIEKQLIIEVKSVDYLLAVHYKQLMTYLKLLHIKDGMLLNFKVEQMKEGIHRVFNNFVKPSFSPSSHLNS
ncbi:MAG TPA: GxxExxY protein [Chitinophagaceae bacterium]